MTQATEETGANLSLFTAARLPVNVVSLIRNLSWKLSAKEGRRVTQGEIVNRALNLLKETEGV